MYELFNQFIITEFRNIQTHTIFRYEGNWYKKTSTFGYSCTDHLIGVSRTDFLIAVPKNEMPNLFRKLTEVGQQFPLKIK